MASDNLQKRLDEAERELREIKRMAYSSGAPSGPLLYQIRFLLDLLR